MYRAMQKTVDQVGSVTITENIDCHWAKGGTVSFARSPSQLERAREEVAEARMYGFDETDLRLLTAEEARDQAQASDVLGGIYTPHCAAIHPARLARGLASLLRERGVLIYERTPVSRIEPGRLVTPLGTVKARHVVRATEGYTPECPARSEPSCRCTRWSSPPRRCRRRSGSRSALTSGPRSATCGT